MNPLRYISAGLGLALLLAFGVIGHVIHQRDALRSAVSIAAHAKDKHNRPVTLGVRGAIAQITILGNAVDNAGKAQAKAALADSNHALSVERNDTRINQEVSSDVLAKYDRVQAELVASRALAAQRLRDLAAARADQSGGGAARVAEDADATCRANFAAACDEVLALLAEAERNTAGLLGWQRWWADVRAARDAADALPVVLPER